MINNLVSVIIPTYNGEKKILNVLRALENQIYKDFEVIVVIDGSTDNTFKVLMNHSFNLRDFQIIQQENNGRAGVRNSGATKANGSLLIFFDDDTRPQPNCVQLHIEHHKLKPMSIAVGHVPEDLSMAKTDFQKYKCYLTEKWTHIWSEGEIQIPFDKPYLTAANFSIPKTIFEKLNGFDNNLNDSEDFDLAVRASELKIPSFFLYKAIAYHDDFLSCRSYIKRLRQYKSSHEKLKELKPDLYNRFNQYEYKKIAIHKKLIYSMFTFKLWVNIIDSTFFFQILPKKIRFKLYDIITTGFVEYFRNRNL